VTTKPLKLEALEGLLGVATKPEVRPPKKVLVVDNDEVERARLLGLIEANDLEITSRATGADALKAIRAEPVDCVILRNPLPDMSAVKVAQELIADEALRNISVIVLGGRPLPRQQVARLAKDGKNLKLRNAATPDQVRHELDTLLRPAALAKSNGKAGDSAAKPDVDVLAGKRVLVVDDDLRNIFALTSLLERYKMEIRHAENGRAAIDTLQDHPDTDIVLMDVMMPEMDGYDTMRAIRAIDRFRGLPIVALTARAMRGDREKCIEAGASDYIPKPVVPEQLLALLRVWFKK
jgi:CheY-like chemotaxis protein